MASSPSPTTPLTNKLQGNSPNSVNIEPSKERPRPLVGEDSPGRDPLTRASDTLSSLGSTMDISERIWEHVVMVDETGLPIAVGHDGADSDDESICSDSSSPAAEASIQRVMGTLVELVAPGDGGAGLAAAERKRVFEFADACLAHGGSSQTITDILRSATRPGQGISPGSFDSNRLLETYLETICSGDGWVEETFTVATGHAVTSRWNSKIVNDLVELVQDPVLFENMILRPHYDGKRFGHPTTGLHMQAFYSLVRKQRKAVGDWNKKKDVVLLLVFFSDATLLANKGSLSAHPVMLSIGNLPASLAQKSQIMLGLLAEFDKGVKINGDSNQKNLTEEEHGQIRRALMAKQTAAMVAPLVHASYEGIRFTSPLDGEQMRMFPTLFCAPLDHPEICSHLGIKNGYCGVCKWMPKNNDKDRAEYRKEGDSVLFVDTISKAPARNIHALKKKQGAHGQRSGLWGFNGSSPVDRIPRSLSQATKVGVQKVGCSTPWTDLHLSVAGETMHEIDLGILVYAKNAVVQHLRDGLDKSDQEIEAINEALRLAMAEESRWPGLPYPPTKKVTAVLQGYLGGSSRIEAGEHRAVLQFIVPILVRFLGMDDPSTRLMAHIVEYYRARQVRDQEIQPVDRVHTLESLDRVDELFSEVKRSLQEIGFSNTSKETPKMHQQTHFRLQVMRLGLSSITTGQAGEANNARLKAPVKAGRTNKQKGVVLRTIVKLYRRSRASAAASRDKLRGRVVCRTSTLARRYKRHGYLAVQRDQCVYPNQRYVPKQNRFTTLDIYNWTRFRLGSAAHPRQMAKRDATIDLRRDLFDSVPIDSLKDKDSPLNRQLETVFGDWTVGRAFANELSFFLTGEKDSFAYGVNLVLKTVPAASNPSVVSRPSREETEVRVLHKIHADPNYRGSNTTWYDFIAIKGEVPDKGDQVWYARLVLLFHIRDPRKKGKWRQLAFVRYLTRQELLQDELQRLRRPGEPQTTSLTFSKRQRNGKVVWYYGVCSSEAILRRIHVVAGNSEGSVSLRYSKGDRRYFEVDRKAKFLLNYNIFEYPTPAYYRPRPPDDEASTSEPQSSTSSPSSL